MPGMLTNVVEKMDRLMVSSFINGTVCRSRVAEICRRLLLSLPLDHGLVKQ